jgi:formate dehydrogenase iron-sulfur subunit
MSKGCLIDTTKCIGCRACQVACKRWNGLPAEKTKFFSGAGGYQNPGTLSSKTFSLVTFNETRDAAGRINWSFAKRQCMHCIDPACASACLVGALEKTPEGPVVYHDEKCIGCRYCMLACPFDVPTFEWEKPVPYIRKCTFCSERLTGPGHYAAHRMQVAADVGDATVNGEPLSEECLARHRGTQRMSSCAKACPTGALQFGEREELLAEARRRIAAERGRYTDHIYGEHEAGGTSMLYLAGVPFEQLGFPTDVGTRPYPLYTKIAMESVPAVMLGVGALLTGVYWVSQRRSEREAQMAAQDAADTEQEGSDEA